jgi:hypothetical protein
MKNMIKLLCAFTIFLMILSCKNTNDQDSQTNTQNTDENNLSDQNNINSKRIKKSMDDQVHPLVQKHFFFEEIRDIKSGTYDGVEQKVNSSCEFLITEGKEILDGNSTVKIKSMGFGNSVIVNFKNGKLDGVAYETFSNPDTYILRLVYSSDKLMDASFFRVSDNTCSVYIPKNKNNLKALRTEFNSMFSTIEIDEHKFKPIDCPEDILDLHKEAF